MKTKSFFTIATLAGIGMTFFPAFSPYALAGTVITTNLPANTAIINISGTQDGAANFSGVNSAFWYHPFFTGGASGLLTYTVQPGTYGFQVIDAVDALKKFPSLTAGQTAEMFTGWTFNSPWVTDYIVFDSSAATNAAEAQLFDGAFSNTNGVTWTYYSDGPSAYQAAISNKFYNLIRPDPAGRAGTNYSTTYTFNAAQTLIFAVPDYQLADNNGGVSVLISPAVNIARPTLVIFSASPGFVTLQWSTNAAGFNLEREINLGPPTWATVTNVPGVSATNYLVTLPVDVASSYFRLHHP